MTSEHPEKYIYCENKNNQNVFFFFFFFFLNPNVSNSDSGDKVSSKKQSQMFEDCTICERWNLKTKTGKFDDSCEFVIWLS